MSDKRFAKMDKVKLLELLCQLTEENEKLTKRTAGMEEANAELMLRSRELEAQANEEKARAEKCLSELQEARQALKDAEEARQALPMGSFADAVMQTYEIAQRTQAAADEYMEACRRKLQEAEEQAAAAVCHAQEEADALMRQAREQAEATFRRAEEHLAQKTEEAENVLRSAQEKAAEETLRAEEHCKALEQKESEIRQRLRAEIDGLNRMVARLDEEQV